MCLLPRYHCHHIPKYILKANGIFEWKFCEKTVDIETFHKKVAILFNILREKRKRFFFTEILLKFVGISRGQEVI